MALLDGRRPIRPKALVRGVVRKSCPVHPWNLSRPRVRKILTVVCAIFLAFVMAAIVAVPAFSQTSVNDVHVVPREPEKSKAPVEEVVKQSLITPSLDARVRPLKVAV